MLINIELLTILAYSENTGFRLRMQACPHKPLPCNIGYLLVVFIFSAGRLPPPFLPEPSPPFNEDYPQKLLEFNDLRDIQILQTRRTICYNQTVYDDVRLEADEWTGLTLTIRTRTARTVTGIDHTAIRIIDDDGWYKTTL